MEPTPKTPLEQNALEDVITSILTRADQELFALSREGLESRWHFRYDTARSPEANLYDFHKMLHLYGGACRRWEEHHNGICCVVERVRDTYLLPKIRQFTQDLAAQMKSP
jgi:hypothetical protein